jgi:cell division septum initiation protein DivIVA
MSAKPEDVTSEVVLKQRIAMLDELLAEATSRLATMSSSVSSAESAVQAVLENQRLSVVALTEIQTKAADVTTAATQAIAAKTQIVDDQTVIATKSDHIQQAQLHADKVRGDLDRVLTAATQQATDAEALKSRAQSASDSAASLLIEVKAVKSSADIDSSSIQAVLVEAEKAVVQTKSLADKANTIEERIAKYESDLNELKKACDSQLQTIKGLLPGATSAGLAHAFDERRQTFLKPTVRWQWLFVGSVLAIVALALSGMWNAYTASAVLSYDELLRLWLARLPIAGALVWLALYAGRESAMAKRLEEDYGYKSVIASSFQGFNQQMSEIGDKADQNAPLAKLCADTLTTIASPPGRIYEKHALTISPSTEVTEVVKGVVDRGGNKS